MSVTWSAVSSAVVNNQHLSGALPGWDTPSAMCLFDQYVNLLIDLFDKQALIFISLS